MNNLTCPNCHEKIKPGERNCPSCGCLLSKVDTSYKKEIILEKEIQKSKLHVTKATYKICANCKETNSATAIVCVHCQSLLTSSNTIVADENYSDKIDEAIAKKEKKKLIKNISFYIICTLILTIIFIFKEQMNFTVYFIALIYMGIAVLANFFPRIHFILSLRWIWVSGGDDFEPSELYVILIRISSYYVPIVLIIALLAA